VIGLKKHDEITAVSPEHATGICIDLSSKDDTKESGDCTGSDTWLEVNPAVDEVVGVAELGSCVITGIAGDFVSATPSCTALNGFTTDGAVTSVAGSHEYTKATCTWTGVTDTDCPTTLETLNQSIVCDKDITTAPFTNAACVTADGNGTFFATKGTCAWSDVTEDTCTSDIGASSSDWTGSGSSVCEVQFH